MDASLKRMMMDEDVYNSYEFKQQLLAAVSSLPQSLRITFSEAFQKRKGDYFSRSYYGTSILDVVN